MTYPHPAHTKCKYCEAMISPDQYVCAACSDKAKTIKVVESPETCEDYRYIATFGDHNLGCKVGLGETEKDAIDDLMWKVT